VSFYTGQVFIRTDDGRIAGTDEGTIDFSTASFVWTAPRARNARAPANGCDGSAPFLRVRDLAAGGAHERITTTLYSEASRAIGSSAPQPWCSVGGSACTQLWASYGRPATVAGIGVGGVDRLRRRKEAGG